MLYLVVTFAAIATPMLGVWLHDRITLRPSEGWMALVFACITVSTLLGAVWILTRAGIDIGPLVAQR